MRTASDSYLPFRPTIGSEPVAGALDGAAFLHRRSGATVGDAGGSNNGVYSRGRLQIGKGGPP